MYHVDIMGVSEDLFWNSEIYMLDRIVKNKQAYKGWINSQREKHKR